MNYRLTNVFTLRQASEMLSKNKRMHIICSVKRVCRRKLILSKNCVKQVGRWSRSWELTAALASRKTGEWPFRFTLVNTTESNRLQRKIWGCRYQGRTPTTRRKPNSALVFLSSFLDSWSSGVAGWNTNYGIWTCRCPWTWYDTGQPVVPFQHATSHDSSVSLSTNATANNRGGAFQVGLLATLLYLEPS